MGLLCSGHPYYTPNWFWEKSWLFGQERANGCWEYMREETEYLSFVLLWFNSIVVEATFCELQSLLRTSLIFHLDDNSL